ncbi:MAG: nucleotide pyrophosphohydrolase, partial [Clostridiales bacterium]
MNEELQKQILAFRDDRNWSQFHNPKDLAISISLEAAELLENFQWSGSETEVP